MAKEGKNIPSVKESTNNDTIVCFPPPSPTNQAMFDEMIQAREALYIMLMSIYTVLTIWNKQRVQVNNGLVTIDEYMQ